MTLWKNASLTHTILRDEFYQSDLVWVVSYMVTPDLFFRRIAEPDIFSAMEKMIQYTGIVRHLFLRVNDVNANDVNKSVRRQQMDYCEGG